MMQKLYRKMDEIGIRVASVEINQAYGEIPGIEIRGLYDPRNSEEDVVENRMSYGALVSNILAKDYIKEKKPEPFAVKKIQKNGDYMTVLWEDGTHTVVKRAQDEPESDYAAFTAALGRKVYGSNSALKRIVASAKTIRKKKG